MSVNEVKVLRLDADTLISDIYREISRIEQAEKVTEVADCETSNGVTPDVKERDETVRVDALNMPSLTETRV